MLMTLALVGAQFLLLSVIGLAVLAPLTPDLRDKLLPAAPVFGAVLIAVVANWTCRWLSIRQSLPIIGAVAVLLLVYGFVGRRRPLRIPGAGWGGVALAVVACVGGFTLASLPVAHVGDTDAVAPSYVVDEFYFGGVSTYLVDHPLLPGPTMTDSWVGNDPPATAPAADTVHNRLRFGQSAVAAALSVLVLHSPYTTVSSIGLLWLLLLAVSALVVASLLGASRGASCAAAAVVTSSFYVVSQSLEGKNDGLLGVSLGLLAFALSVKLLEDSRYSWPLLLVGAGLAATYSEYFILLVPALVALALLGRPASLLHRLNLIGGCWAASAFLVPWAWVWMVQSFKITTRTTNGPNPFVGRSGWELVRVYLGVGSVRGADVGLLTAVSVAVLVAICVGWGTVLLWHQARAAFAGLLVAFAGLQWYAIAAGSGNIQYRAMQLALPALLVFAVLGWELVVTRVRDNADGFSRVLARVRLVPVTAVVIGLAFMGTNLLTVGRTTSFERAANQHVPARFMNQTIDLVKRVGADEVSVVAPVLTDVAAFSMALDSYPEVEYPTVPPSEVYVGNVPHWSRGNDPYYVVGPGATVLGDATMLEHDGGYAIVQLGRSGMIIAPFQAGWARTTWMRGFPCAHAGVQLVILRGGTAPQMFQVAVRAKGPIVRGLQLVGENGKSVPVAETARRTDGWTVQTFRAPQQANAILTVRPSGDFAVSRTTAFPLVLDGSELSSAGLGAVDRTLTDFCLMDQDSGMDGYDREITFMRSAP